MKKIISRIVTFLEIALLIAAYLVNYFTPKKMGMFRFVGYKNMMWEQQYNIPELQNIFLMIIIVLSIAVIISLIVKRNSYNIKLNIKTVLFTVLLTGFYILFANTNSTETYKAYYFICALSGIATLLQILKNLISVIFTKAE